MCWIVKGSRVYSGCELYIPYCGPPGLCAFLERCSKRRHFISTGYNTLTLIGDAILFTVLTFCCSAGRCKKQYQQFWIAIGRPWCGNASECYSRSIKHSTESFLCGFFFYELYWVRFFLFFLFGFISSLNYNKLNMYPLCGIRESNTAPPNGEDLLTFLKIESAEWFNSILRRFFLNFRYCRA